MAFLEFRPTQTLYQYCPVDSFLAIAKSKRLWFSDLTSANDPRELKLGYNNFIEALKSVRHDEYRGEPGRFLSKLAYRLVSYRDVAQAFCACFSLAKDELPLWNAYGENYGGVAIGFRPTAILQVPARIQKVRYVGPETSEEFRRLVLEIAHKLNSDINSNEFWIFATVDVFAAITALKHSSWSYEREVRIVHVQTREPDTVVTQTGELPDGTPIHWSKPLERPNRDGSLSYLEFPYGRFQNGRFDPTRAIEKVILGPNCRLTKSEATDVMRDNGFKDFEVTKSECEIR